MDRLAAEMTPLLNEMVMAFVRHDIGGACRQLDAVQDEYGHERMWIVAAAFGEGLKMAVQRIAEREEAAIEHFRPTLAPGVPRDHVFAAQFGTAWCAGDVETAGALYRALDSWPDDSWEKGMVALGSHMGLFMRAAFGDGS
jgi:hypothetical protein